MMDTLPGEAEAGERLKQTALRGFGPIPEDHEPWGPSYKLTLSQDDAPVPSLLKYALTLIGLKAYGPAERSPGGSTSPTGASGAYWRTRSSA